MPTDTARATIVDFFFVGGWVLGWGGGGISFLLFVEHVQVRPDEVELLS